MGKLKNIHPGEILLEEFLKPLGVSQYELAKKTQMPHSRVSRIIHGTQNISPDTALRLSRFFSNSPSFWLGLQGDYDLAHEQLKKQELLDQIPCCKKIQEIEFIKNFLFFKKLTQFQGIEDIYLYGSRARGDFKERSDIDLALECPSLSKKDWVNVLEIIEDADTLLKVDCVRLDELKENDPLKNNILKDRILLWTR